MNCGAENEWNREAEQKERADLKRNEIIQIGWHIIIRARKVHLIEDFISLYFVVATHNRAEGESLGVHVGGNLLLAEEIKLFSLRFQLNFEL